MAIGDIFRRKHKHSDVTVRLEAVAALGAEDAELIAEIARTDDAAAVRRAAILKMDDPEELASVAATDLVPAVSQMARGRAVERWVASALAASDEDGVRAVVERLAQLGESKAVGEIALRLSATPARKIALDRVSNPRVLADLVRGLDDDELRADALGLIHDETVLRAIAIDEERKEIAMGALQRIVDRGALEDIAQKGKNKAVRSQARKQLGGKDEVLTAPDADKQRIAERTQLLVLMETLAMAGEWNRSYNHAIDAERRWGQLRGEHDDEMDTRFARASERYFVQYDEYQKARRAAADREAAAQSAKVEREVASALASANADGAEPAVGDGDVSPEEDVAVEATEQADAPEVVPGKPSDEERAANLLSFEQLCERLEALATADKLKNCERKLNQIAKKRELIGAVPGPARRQILARYEEAHRLAIIRLGELREAEEWKRWANVPKQKELIANAKALAHSEPDQHLASKLKLLQAEWKGMGPAPRGKSQELWLEFKAACDELYAVVKKFRAEFSDVQKENLAKKEELCARAEELSTSTDWVRTAEELKRLQGEWKQVGPTPRRQADAVWKRFRSACDAFFERRKPHLDRTLAERSENYDRKLVVVEKLESLAKSEDLERAAGEVAKHKARWRQIGQIPQAQFAELSKRLNAATEAIFAGRDRAREESRAQELKAVADLVSEIEGLLAGTELAELPTKIVAARANARAIASHGTDESKQLIEKVDSLSCTALERHGELFKGTELDPIANRRRKEKLCRRVEKLIPSAEPERPAATAEDMAAKLRAALADRALGGVLSKEAKREDPHLVVAEARQSWSRLGPLPGPDGAKLEQRFAAACERAASGSS